MEHSLLIFGSISLLCVATHAFIDVPEDSGIKMEAVPPTVNILELDKDNFHDVVDRHSDKHVVVEIYSSKSWCVHCRKLEPIFNDLAVWYEQKGLNEREIVFVRIDVSDGNKPKDLNVIGYPSIKAYRKGKDEVDYWGQNNHDDILNFLEFTVRGVKPDEL